MKKIVAIAAAAAILAGCAAPMHQYHPLVDTDGLYGWLRRP